LGGLFVIKGGSALQGRVVVSGAKNAALPILAAVPMARGQILLDNVPPIADVEAMLALIAELGVSVQREGEGRLVLVPPDRPAGLVSYHLAKRLRASNLLLGSLLARNGLARVPLPGGCDIGSRPMDLHLKAFRALGAEVEMDHGFVTASGSLVGTEIYLDFPSVGATENAMMAACGALGQTVIINAAREPEVVDLANFINTMGGRVRGAGTGAIRVDGPCELAGGYYSVIPDRIEAGTFMVGAVMTGGDVVVDAVIPTHLQPVIAKLREVGAEVFEEEERIRVVGRPQLRPLTLKTMPYPGFPTDLQPQMTALLSIVKGTSLVVENLFENRLRIACELQRMGADIKVEGQAAVVEGVGRLSGSRVQATDLRCGAALVLAGLVAEGQTEVDEIHFIERGYVNLDHKLNSLGAMIRRAGG